MKQTKFKITIFALALALVCSLAVFFAINFKPAEAAGTVSVSGTNIFTASGEANVIVDRQEQEEEGQYKYYTMFTFGDEEDNVSFRKNLAYNWYETSDDEEKSLVHGYFNMEIGFKNTAFEKFIITLESQQYTKTEEGKTLNYIIFFPAINGVKACVTQDKDATVDEADNVVLDLDHIFIKFISRFEDKYGVIISNDADAIQPDSHAVYDLAENVGGNYSKYSSSSTTPVYPLIFSAQFAEEELEDQTEEKQSAQMVLYCLNNQKFEITGATDRGDYFAGGNATDDTGAVLCLNSEITNLTVGGTISFDYQVIDVLRSTPSSTLYYYLLRYDDVVAEEAVDFNDIENGKFKEVETDTLLESDVKYYLPEGNDLANFAEDFDVDMALKVYVKVSDTTSGGTDSYVFLDWYLNDEHKVSVNGFNFIAVGDDKQGVTYNKNDETLTWEEICNAYQKEVTKAAKNLYAGSASYFYLPSAEQLFVDNATSYADMKISIYYQSNEDSLASSTSLATNNLSINVTQPGPYVFTLYATDASSNSMYYYDGEEMVEFTGSDISEMYNDDDKRDILPWFSFSVDYKGVQFKEVPGQQSTAFVGVTYSSASFEINGVDGSYETNYRLFLFDRAAYYADTNIAFTYDAFIKEMDALFEGDETRKYFKEIKEVTETDENYEEFKDYAWSSSSTSFVPQDANAFYYMRAEVTDTAYNTDPVTCSLAIVASVEAKALKGDSEWLQNNVASVILLSVAGVSLIAIILLLVIKPKNKEDIDVQFEKEISKKNKNK